MSATVERTGGRVFVACVACKLYVELTCYRERREAADWSAETHNRIHHSEQER